MMNLLLIVLMALSFPLSNVKALNIPTVPPPVPIPGDTKPECRMVILDDGTIILDCRRLNLTSQAIKCKIKNGTVECPNVKPGQTISCTGSAEDLDCEVIV